ncbi:TPA: helix-turn-helix domain-containing protein [Clostridioides difficile]
MNRLKKLRNDMNLSEKELGNILEIPYESISKYENEEVEISLNLLKKLSNFYGVSVDYILGLSTLKTYHIEKEEAYLDNNFDEFKLLSLILNRLKKSNSRVPKIQFDVYELEDILNIQDKEHLICMISEFFSKLLKTSYKATVHTIDKIYHIEFNLLTKYSFYEDKNIFEITMNQSLCEHFEKYNFSTDITLSVDSLFNTKISQLFFHFKE